MSENIQTKKLKDNQQHQFYPETSVESLVSTSVGGGGKFLTTKQIEGEVKVVDTEVSIANVPQITGTTESGHFASFDSNGGLQDSGKKSTDFATVLQGVKADNAIQGIIQGGVQLEPDLNNKVTIVPDIIGAHAITTPAGTNASASIDSNKVLQLNIPQGHNPNLGTYNIVSGVISPAPPITGVLDGDYIVVVDAETDPSNVTSEIYTFNGTNWFTTHRSANDAEFETGQKIYEVSIDNTHLINVKNSSIPSASDVMDLKSKLQGVDATETKIILEENSNWYDELYLNVNGNIATSSGTSETEKNGLLVINVENKKRVRFLGVVVSGTSTVVGYGFSSLQSIDEDDLTNIQANLNVREFLTTGNDNIAGYSKDYIVEVPKNAKWFLCTIRKYDNSLMTISDFYCYTQVGETISTIVSKVDNKIGLQKEVFDYNGTSGSGIIPGSTDISCYLTDINNVVFAAIKKDGSILKFVKSEYEKNIDNILYNLSHSISIEDSNVLKYITDEDGTCFAHIEKDGTLYVNSLSTSHFKSKDETSSLVGLLMSSLTDGILKGKENHDFCTDFSYLFLKSIKEKYHRDGVLEVNTAPAICFHDDDTADPGLGGYSSSSNTRHGFGTLLYPFMKSFYENHKEQLDKIPRITLATQGNKVGFTNDGPTEPTNPQLSLRGKAVKELVERCEWESVCHSMTPRYAEDSFVVDSLESTMATTMITSNSYPPVVNPFSISTIQVYNREDNKNYYIGYNQNNEKAWVILPDKFIRPVCATNLSNSEYIPNPTYSFDYQINRWYEIADNLNFPYLPGVIVCWGTSHTSWHLREDLKRVNIAFGTQSYEPKNIPLDSTISRCPLEPSGSSENNHYDQSLYIKLINAIDQCCSTNSFLVIRTHSHQHEHDNFYQSGTSYYTEINPDMPSLEDLEISYIKSNNYNTEWELPLNEDEWKDMVGDNIHNYWENPPQRLGINNWSEWKPCPGTNNAMLWNVMCYALDRGVLFMDSEEIINMFGNIFMIGTNKALGVDGKMSSEYSYRAYFRIAKDGCIDFDNITI